MTRRPVRIGWWSYGVRLAIEIEPTLAARVRAILPPGRALAPPAEPDRAFKLLRVDGSWALWRDRRRIRNGLDRAAALDALASALQLAVATRAPAHLFVHAGVVGWRGRAIVLPGRSRAGKSTLVAALVRAGATYYSDEYAVLDGEGRVLPFPRPLALRRPGGGVRRVTAATLGARTGKAALPVGLVLSCRYRAGQTRLRPLTPGQAVLALLRHTVAARTRPVEAIDRLGRVARRAKALYGERGDARAFARLLLDEE